MQMGANVTVTSGLKKRSTRTGDESRSQIPENSTEENIAKLAYALWEQRGCPYGSPEFDWLEAEQKVLGCSKNISR